MIISDCIKFFVRNVRGDSNPLRLKTLAMPEKTCRLVRVINDGMILYKKLLVCGFHFRPRILKPVLGSPLTVIDGEMDRASSGFEFSTTLKFLVHL